MRFFVHKNTFSTLKAEQCSSCVETHLPLGYHGHMGRTVVSGRFEWDEQKAKLNVKKHKISFEAILPMLNDPMFIEDFDEENSTSDESRFRTIGQINGFAIVASCYTHRNGRIRIINARRATPKERHYYEQRCDIMRDFFTP